MILTRAAARTITRRAGRRGLSNAAVRVEVCLDDDTELPPLTAAPGESLMELLSRSDVGDAWTDAGACGGACACSTCRVVFLEPWRATLPEPSDDELDMLDSAAREHARHGGDEHEFLDGSRLSCQISLTESLDGLRVCLVGVGPNMLEVPLWLRNR